MEKNKRLCGLFFVIILIMLFVLKEMVNCLFKAKDTIEAEAVHVGSLDRYYNLFEHWIEVKNRGSNAADYFRKNNFKEIAVYGMGRPGCLLCNELKDASDVKVKYAIDKNISARKHIVDLRKLTDDVIPVDAVVVTPVTAFDSIKAELEKKFDCPVISLESVIYDL